MMKEIELYVEGMKCSGCENRICNALLLLDEIEKVEANHETGQVLITTNTNLDLEAVKEKIKNLGFEVLK